MIRWRLIGARQRPVPEPVDNRVTWLVATVCAPALITAHNLLDGQGDPWLDHLALSVLCAVLGITARITAAPGTALVCWAFFSLFAAPPLGQFSWALPQDWKRLGILLLTAAIGTVCARLVHARSAHHRLSVTR
ncbi:DUF4118 domain-containing protein [Streptomyces sp. TRM64462]|uniref:DUF4118 domain-containing protein n=1 Tax=Streptomyces sp. TRM64462 TaxID=2741726 RepID=UPI0015866A4E|nr:DUF4118 domain-containing protein [Streptomyces sp. TRM64462]